jgi:hypothetical protein
VYALSTELLVTLEGHAKRDLIVSLLEGGQATYSGGVVRHSAGQRNGGQILAHLQAPPTAVKQLMAEPSALVSNALSLPASASALGMVNVGLAAVNTGIAAYNTYQLHRIQQGLDSLRTTADLTAAGVMQLGHVTGEIRHLVAIGLSVSDDILNVVSDLRRWALLEPELELSAALQGLRDRPDVALDSRLDAVRHARLAFEEFLREHIPDAGDAQQLLQAGHLVRLWSTASTTQVDLLARLSDPVTAVRAASEFADTGRAIAAGWIEELHSDRVVLAAHPALLPKLPAGAWLRLANLSDGAPHRALDGAQQTLHALDATGAAATTDAGWSALAASITVIDGLIESTDVLSSKADLEIAA